MPESTITAYSALQHSFLCVNLLLFGVTVRVITRASTNAMGQYRHADYSPLLLSVVFRFFLLNEAVWSFLFDWATCFTQPVFLYPSVSCGFNSSVYMRHTGVVAQRLVITLFLCTVVGKIHSFGTALAHRVVCAHPLDSRLAKFYAKGTPFLQIGVLSFMIALVVVS